MTTGNPESSGPESDGLESYGAVLFDLDGVLTPTAEVHMRAWARMFTAFLESSEGQPPYTEQDYFDYVDGKPRYDGVRSFLASRGIELPEGTPDDPPDVETICGLGNRKNAEFSRVLESDGVQPYPGSVRLLDHLAASGTPMAVVSSSRNARPVLRAAGLLDRFPVIVDGNVSAERGLAGKPSPDTFAAAASDLDVSVDRAVVVEDALSGVAAGRAGGFGLVVGVDRGAGAERLRESGADIVVADLGELVGE
ncbi:HAD family phosphatase [Microlunatus sp. Gsoil 973]|uniref:HAD family hydrolase n=1 Tax=Microlunatus sp. Gsoil 973 TaxID=2672569 RepID=UPI001E31E685|nr:beta-phosphoglucomutase family hydrolase [Microlunatus sp. Gsoil 973]